MEINEDKYIIVFPKEYEEIAKQIANIMDTYIPLYNKYYNYELTDKVLFFINKSTEQKSNGYSLFNKIQIFTGSNKALDYDLATTNKWHRHLVIHELSHAYQMLSTKFPLKRKILKYDISLILEPNIFIPLSFIEGNGVLMESIFNSGGRLYSGYSKALLNVMINDDKLTKQLLLFNTRQFPYYDTRYLIGGFFMKYLNSKYGLTKVNSYFLKHSAYYLRPLSLGFKEHFNDSFDNIFSNFKKYHKKDKFTKSTGELISKSDVFMDLNKQNNEVYFLSSEVYGKNTLNIFDINTSKLKKKTSIFHGTRVFKIKNKFYFLKNVNIDDGTFYGLYDEDFNLLKDSKSKIFTNIAGKDKYYFDANKSFGKLRLYKNNNFINEVDTSSIVVDDGDLYYFKNINEKRWLIKNNKKIFSFVGYYGFVVDKDKDFIYFIASSFSGSSLFAWDKKKKKVLRVFEGDDIYNAKKIANGYFLISIITSNSYKLLKAKASYFNASVNETKNISNNLKVEIQNKNFKQGTYNPFSSIKVNAISLFANTNKYISLFASDITNSIKINSYLSSYKDAYLYTVKYENDYNDDFKHQAIGTISGQLEVLLFKFLYKNILLEKGNKSSILNIGYEYLDKRKDKNSLSLSLEHSKIYTEIFDSSPSSGYNTNVYLNHIISDGINIKGEAKFYKKITKGLFVKTSIQSAFSTSKAYKNKISIENNAITNEHIKAENYSGDTYNDWVVKSNIQIDYEKYLGFYSKYYISLVKAGVFIGSSHFKSENDSFNEHTIGIKSSLLIGYNNEFDFIVKNIYNGIYGKKYEFQISMGL